MVTGGMLSVKPRGAVEDSRNDGENSKKGHAIPRPVDTLPQDVPGSFHEDQKRKARSPPDFRLQANID